MNAAWYMTDMIEQALAVCKKDGIGKKKEGKLVPWPTQQQKLLKA